MFRTCQDRISRNERKWLRRGERESLSLAAFRCTFPADRKYGSVLVRVVVNQIPPLAFILAGLLALADPNRVPLYAVGVLACFASSVYGAWVSLIGLSLRSRVKPSFE